MAKSLMICGNGTEQLFTRVGALDEVKYCVCANAPLVLESTQSHTQITYHTPGVLSLAKVSVTTNGLANGATIRLQKNGADGSTVIDIPGGGVGTFSATLTDTIADGDEVNWKVTSLADDPALELGIMWISVVFDPTNASETVVIHAAVNFVDMSNGSTFYYAPADECGANNTTEVYARVDFNAAGTLRNLFCKVSSNLNISAGTNTVVRVHIDGASSGITLNIPALEVAQTVFEDTTNEAAVVANNDINFAVVSVNSGAVVLEIVSVEWVSTDQEFHTVFARTGAGFGQVNAVTRHMPVGGGGALSTFVETYHRVPMGFAAQVRNLTAYVSANTLNTPPPATGLGLEFFLQKNGADGANYLQHVEGAAASQIEDSANGDDYVATDDLSMTTRASGGSGYATIRHFAMKIKNWEVSFRPQVMLI
jgi:hypothetical protein